jgi:hypothetical protein
MALDARLSTKGSNLFQFCVEHGLRAAPIEPTDAQILKWVRSYSKEHGKPPSVGSGMIGEADSSDLNWKSLNARLGVKGSSLSQFCVKHRLRASKGFNKAQTLKWVRAYLKKYGAPPSVGSGMIGEADSSDLTWGTLNARLRAKGSSLSQFCVKHGFRDAPIEATDSQIIKWVKSYAKKHGKPPSCKSGLVGEADSEELNWGSLDARLGVKGSSLSQFCKKHGLR